MIPVCADATITAAAHEIGDRSRLLIAVFQQQPTVGVQVSRCVPNQITNAIQTITPAHQCVRGLEAQTGVTQMRIIMTHIGRVANYDVCALSR